MIEPYSASRLEELQRAPYQWMREFGPPFPDFIPEGSLEGSVEGMEDESVGPDPLTQFLEWLWRLKPPQQPEPSAFIGAWPGDRGLLELATIAEMAVVALGATGRRKFCLCVSQTQKRAQERVGNIKRIFQQSHKLAANYPAIVEPARWRNGRARSWNRKSLQCGSGFIVKGLGLRQATHTSNIGGQRPDLIIFENIRVTSRNADKIERQLGSALFGMGPNPGFIVLNDSRTEHGLADALTDGLLPGFFASRTVCRSD